MTKEIKADKQKSSWWVYPDTRERLAQLKLDLDISTHDGVVTYLLDNRTKKDKIIYTLATSMLGRGYAKVGKTPQDFIRRAEEKVNEQNANEDLK